MEVIKEKTEDEKMKLRKERFANSNAADTVNN